MNTSESQRSRNLSWIVLLLVLAYSAWVGYLIFFRVPVFKKFFSDLNAALPGPTTWFLSPWPKFIVVGVTVLALLKQLLIRNGPFNLTVNGLLLVGMFAFEKALIESLYLPLFDFVKAVIGGAG
jgi:hypothetical protein